MNNHILTPLVIREVVFISLIILPLSKKASIREDNAEV